MLFRCSSILEDLGKKILPEDIVGLLRSQGGEMPQKDVIHALKERAHENTIRKAIVEAEKQKRLRKERIPGKHGKILLSEVPINSLNTEAQN